MKPKTKGFIFLFFAIGFFSVVFSAPDAGSRIVTLVLSLLCFIFAFRNFKKAPPKDQVSKRVVDSPKDNANAFTKTPSVLDNYIPQSKTIVLTKVPSDAVALNKLTDYAVVDIETTGLERGFNRIVEISVLTIKNAEVIDTFTSLINPNMPIPASASAINGITDKMVADAPPFSMVAPTIAGLLLGKTVIAHNATFDLHFIIDELGDRSGEIFYLDTVPLARKAFPDAPNHKLQTLISYLGIHIADAHRATDDAVATQVLFEKCRTALTAQNDQKKAEQKAHREAAKQEKAEKFGSSPLYDVNFAFIGDLDADWDTLCNLTASVGANARTDVNTKTRYLVKGRFDNLLGWGAKSQNEKLEKANALIASGKPIEIISEADFLALIANAKRALEK